MIKGFISKIVAFVKGHVVMTAVAGTVLVTGTGVGVYYVVNNNTGIEAGAQISDSELKLTEEQKKAEEEKAKKFAEEKAKAEEQQKKDEEAKKEADAREQAIKDGAEEVKKEQEKEDALLGQANKPKPEKPAPDKPAVKPQPEKPAPTPQPEKPVTPPAPTPEPPKPVEPPKPTRPSGFDADMTAKLKSTVFKGSINTFELAPIAAYNEICDRVLVGQGNVAGAKAELEAYRGEAHQWWAWQVKTTITSFPASMSVAEMAGRLDSISGHFGFVRVNYEASNDTYKVYFAEVNLGN